MQHAKRSSISSGYGKLAVVRGTAYRRFCYLVALGISRGVREWVGGERFSAVGFTLDSREQVVGA